MSLEIILGPMFSGKTSRIIDIYEKCVLSNINVVVINHASDTRYSTTMLSTHDQKMIPCILCDSNLYLLNENADNYKKIEMASVILINEGQFFENLFEWVKYRVDHFKQQVHVCGLDGDFQREKFGQMLDLIPICDKVTKLRSLCTMCKNGKKAPFTLRLAKTCQQILIGADASYAPVCRECYLMHCDWEN
jgi:thymidine kinase